MSSAYSLKQELELLLKEKDDIDLRFRKITNDIIQYSDRLKNINPFNPLEIEIPAASKIAGKSIRQLRFRQTADCLIIAIRRQTQVYVAPEPDDILQEGDRIVVIGSAAALQNIKDFIN